MISNLYTIRDDQAGTFGPLFQARNHALMGRIVEQSCGGTSNVMGQYPNDFSVYHVGSFDDDLAELSPIIITKLGTVADYMRKS
uniref:phage ORF5 protein n=1 Tax=Yoonia sp. TaxID=2212373 RepID=UPI0040472CB7